MKVEWIKLATGIFDDPKIKTLRKGKNGAEIVLLFIQLLTLAGQENNGGVFTWTDGSPYTADDFSAVTGYDANFIEEAFAKFRKLGMIAFEDETVCILNWSKHQSEDKLSVERSKSAERQKRYRENQKMRASAESFSVDSDGNLHANLHAVEVADLGSWGCCEKSESFNVGERNASHNSNVTHNVTSNVTERNTSRTERDKDLDLDNNIYTTRESPDLREYGAPSLEDVKKEHAAKKYTFNADVFFNKMCAVGWCVGGQPVHDYKALMRVWQERENEHKGNSRASPGTESTASYDLSDFVKKSVGIRYKSAGGSL